MIFRSRRVLFCLLFLGVWMTARGELVLNHYNAANPIKVMAIGDSITDDCVANGAWRQYLQLLLESNGYPFTFVGRNQSAPVGAFTKTAHEGYCGAVVAPPGVLSYAVHGYAGTDVYLQKIVADALTNVTPDLVLVLVGANDIGRGRNPYQVATNDMPNLLDIIFSNAPNANVILAKITSLQSANVGSPNYGVYYTNVSIYNAALQAMVNQRRGAAGLWRPGGAHDGQLWTGSSQPICHHILSPLVRRAGQRGFHQSQFPPLAGGWRGGLAQWSGSFPHQHANRADHLHEPG